MCTIAVHGHEDRPVARKWTRTYCVLQKKNNKKKTWQMTSYCAQISNIDISYSYIIIKTHFFRGKTDEIVLLSRTVLCEKWSFLEKKRKFSKQKKLSCDTTILPVVAITKYFYRCQDSCIAIEDKLELQ